MNNAQSEANKKNVRLETIKADIGLFQARVPGLRLSRNSWWGQCPLHEDSNPSLKVDNKNGSLVFYCFGCGAGGSVIDLEIRLKGCDKGEAIRHLSDELSHCPAALPALPLEESELSFAGTEDMVRGYEHNLEGEDEICSPVWQFLHKSGLADIARSMRLGYVKEKFFYCPQRCDKCGNYPAWVIPLFWDGKLVGLKYRNLDPDAGSEHKWTQIPGSKSDFLWLADTPPADPQSSIIAVFEGIRDALLARQLGFNSCAILSASSIPEDNPSERLQASIKGISEKYTHAILIGDQDEAGKDAMNRLHELSGRGSSFAHCSYKDLSAFHEAKGPGPVKAWLKGMFGAAAECMPFPKPGDELRQKVRVLFRKAAALEEQVEIVEPRLIIEGLESELSQLTETPYPAPEPLKDIALQGPVGWFIEAAEKYTEADYQCLALQFLTAMGNLLGPGNYGQVGSERHYPNLFTLIVGPTSSGKGHGLSTIRALAKEIDQKWTDEHIHSSAASGEGLVRMLSEIENKEDKRILLSAREMSIVLGNARREGSNLSAYLREAYDGLPIENFKAKSRIAAKDYFLSVIGHITPHELSRVLGDVDWFNGLANRFTWGLVEQSKVLARIPRIPGFGPVADTLRNLAALSPIGEIPFSEEGGNVWDAWVESLPKPKDERMGAAQERIRPNTLRTALIYALLDPDRLGPIEKVELLPRHVEAAIEIARYSMDTVRWFLERPPDIKQDDDVAKIQKIRVARNKNGELTGTELCAVLPNESADRRNELATRAGLWFKEIRTGGRPRKVWT